MIPHPRNSTKLKEQQGFQCDIEPDQKGANEDFVRSAESFICQGIIQELLMNVVGQPVHPMDRTSTQVAGSKILSISAAFCGHSQRQIPGSPPVASVVSLVTRIRDSLLSLILCSTAYL